LLTSSLRARAAAVSNEKSDGAGLRLLREEEDLLADSRWLSEEENVLPLDEE
jgi:hypothetical protein